MILKVFLLDCVCLCEIIHFKICPIRGIALMLKKSAMTYQVIGSLIHIVSNKVGTKKIPFFVVRLSFSMS